MSSHTSVPAEVRAILASSPGVPPVRPNTPVLPLESPYATASFIDPTVNVIAGNRASVGQKDFIAPFVTLDASRGVIKIGSSTTIQDNARLIANPSGRSGLTGILVGDNVVVGDGAIVRGPSSIGRIGGEPTSIGANARIIGAIIEPGAFVGALARVGPGVTVPSGFRVLPGASVTTNAQASDPSLGRVVRVTPSDSFASTTTKVIAANSALAIGYATLFHGNSATGGTSSIGPIPGPILASGSGIYFGALNNILGASSEPGSKNVPFEPTAGTPLFASADGSSLASLDQNTSYRFPARVIGQVTFGQTAGKVQSALGQGVSIRADEGQPFTFRAIAKLGNNVSIHSPLGGVQATTTTTVTTTTTTVTGETTTNTTTSVVKSAGAPTATSGTTTAATSGINAQGVAFTGTTVTTIATKTTNLGVIGVGKGFRALNGSVILGGPSASSTFGDNVTIGAGAVVDTSSIGNGAVIGRRAYIENSTIAAGAVIPAGAIIINDQIAGTIAW
ncbi:carbonic anhydrase/acetyltransferase [Tundrisphaera lichenicola]|uniref:carbonic anhydrase/acetyltransferase n=1 Tax=Tundrisphaera lichenicola TaxID=2029860 RepID=UPI003EC0EB53